MTDIPILSLVTYFPLLGVALIFLFVNGVEEKTAGPARLIALVTCIINAIISLYLFQVFDPANPGFQLVEKHVWMEKWGIAYHKGVDGISVWFVLISALLAPICVLSAYSGITKRTKEFMIALLVLQTMMIGMFTALDLVLLYLFFEGVLIPMFLMIGIWGGQGRIYAAFKFFLYTFAGSVLLLLGLMVLAIHGGTTDMTVLMKNPDIPFDLARWLWLAFFAAFAVKTPMWPFHTWLPFAHVEAPTAGSVILAGVLLKMGGYGLMRFQMQLLPEASHYFSEFVLVLSVIAIIYTSLVALAQTDLKKLIAYSSVAHMGYVTLGLFAGN
ncbi:MAG: NADH-quinone oxidoreductase subunit M, partial [Alphaproteobacteria bacterium]|nr:NADH-quinone oxidoreductase subunit M [Alphaproteobacteria bacterium]